MTGGQLCLQTVAVLTRKRKVRVLVNRRSKKMRTCHKSRIFVITHPSWVQLKNTEHVTGRVTLFGEIKSKRFHTGENFFFHQNSLIRRSQTFQSPNTNLIASFVTSLSLKDTSLNTRFTKHFWISRHTLRSIGTVRPITSGNYIPLLIAFLL